MKWIRAAILAVMGAGVVAVTPADAAVNAFVSRTLSERAGPSTYYPVVTVIPRGATLTLYGCLSGGGWCDVSYAGARGWVPGGYVEAYYRSQRVYVPRYIAQIGVPVVSFNIGFYWSSHYHDRPFFAERFRYQRHGDRQATRVAAAPTRYRNGPGARVAISAAKNGNIGHYTPRQERVKTFAAVSAKGKHRRQIETFASAGPRQGKGSHPMVAAGAAGKGGPQIVAGPKSKIAMGQRRGKPCQKNGQANGACQF